MRQEIIITVERVDQQPVNNVPRYWEIMVDPAMLDVEADPGRMLQSKVQVAGNEILRIDRITVYASARISNRKYESETLCVDPSFIDSSVGADALLAATRKALAQVKDARLWEHLHPNP